MGCKIIGSNLSMALFREGYTQTSFSELTGISRPTINKLCRDKYENMPSDYILEKICTALNVSHEYLEGKEPVTFYKGDPNRKIFELLKDFDKIEPLEDKPFNFKLNGEDESIDLSERELKHVLYFLREKIISACNDYVHIVNNVRDGENMGQIP